MRIKNFNLNDELVLELGKFTVLWNLFEKKHCRNNCTPSTIERIGNQLVIDEAKRKELYKVINIRRIWFLETAEQYTRISLHPGNARMSREHYINYIRDFIEYKGNDLNIGCLLVIHRIRNNLMHGLKDVQQLNNQLDLFKAVNGVLESI